MKHKSSQAKLRIIAGQWRHRTFNFYSAAGARPTLDHVRETVFNWLQPYIQAATCVDLFTGSGAMGIEALSRGAKQVTFVDNQAAALEMINNNLELFQASPELTINFHCTHLPKGLAALASKLNKADIIFIDPPYRTRLLQQCLDYMAKLWIEYDTPRLIYFEADRHDKLQLDHWTMLKYKTTKHSQYGLLSSFKRKN